MQVAQFLVSSIPDIISLIRPPGNQFSLDNAFLAPILQPFLLDTLHLSSATISKSCHTCKFQNFLPCKLLLYQTINNRPAIRFLTQKQVYIIYSTTFTITKHTIQYKIVELRRTYHSV